MIGEPAAPNRNRRLAVVEHSPHPICRPKLQAAPLHGERSYERNRLTGVTVPGDDLILQGSSRIGSTTERRAAWL